MMDRRAFLKVTGLVAVASALDVLPVAAAGPAETVAAGPIRSVDVASAPFVARQVIRQAGTYRISGLVRLEAPLVEITGIANAQQISWSGVGGQARPVTSFSSFEQFDGPGLTPEIQIRGGRLESLSVVALDYV